MTKVSLTLTAKTKNDLSLAPRGSVNITWDDADWIWDEDTSPVDYQRGTLSKEDKTKNDLTLPTK